MKVFGTLIESILSVIPGSSFDCSDPVKCRVLALIRDEGVKQRDLASRMGKAGRPIQVRPLYDIKQPFDHLVELLSDLDSENVKAVLQILNCEGFVHYSAQTIAGKRVTSYQITDKGLQFLRQAEQEHKEEQEQVRASA